MTVESINSRMQRLQTHDKRTLASRFREAYPAIEAALQAGNTRQAVLAELHEGGLPITFNSFKKYLQEARAKYRAAAPPHSLTSGAQLAAPAPLKSSAPAAHSSTADQATPVPQNRRTETELINPAVTEKSGIAISNPVDLRAMRDAPIDYLKLSAIGNAARKAKK